MEHSSILVWQSSESLTYSNRSVFLLDMSNLTAQQAGLATRMNATSEKPSAADKVVVELGQSVTIDVDLSLSEREESLLQGLKSWHSASVHSGIVLGQPM
jgi:hypothetical protein